MKKICRTQNGFALIETIIYVALFSVIIGSLIISIFYIIDNTRSSLDKTASQDELNFIAKKLEWALADISKINEPLSGFSSRLSIDKTGYTNNPIVFRLNKTSGVYEYCEKTCATSADFSPLNPLNVTADTTILPFEYLIKTGSSPAGIRAKIRIDSREEIITKYMPY